MVRYLQQAAFWLFPVIGVLCIFCSEHITAVLPYLLGAAMILAGLIRGALYLQGRNAADRNAAELSYGLILLIMGIVFVIQGANALGPLGTTWGIIGIRKASKPLECAVEGMRLKRGFFRPLVEFVVRLTLALVLLFNPFEKFSAHIVILGIELMVISVRLTGPHPLNRDYAGE